MAIATTMPQGRCGARHIAQWSVSVASCEASIWRHRACAHTVSARRTPWSSPSPSCENTNKTQLLASGYCTFLLTNRFAFGTQNKPINQQIEATNCVKMWNVTIGAEELADISSYQTLWVDKNSKSLHEACQKSWLIYELLAVKLLNDIYNMVINSLND